LSKSKMNWLSKLLSLSSHDRRLLVSAAFFLIIVKLGLLLLPFQKLRIMMARFLELSRILSGRDHTTTIEEVARAVSVASRHIPGTGTCLPMALTAHGLLTRFGLKADLRIGVRRDRKGEFQAHAWVESRNGILICDLENLAQFTPLPHLGQKIL
jgi:hypothetical protein